MSSETVGSDARVRSGESESPAEAGRPSVAENGGVGRPAPSAAPSANGGNGRDAGGRFATGNVGGPGNPFTRQTARLRQLLVEAVSDQDLKDVIAMLVRKAKEGDVAAAKVLLSYVVGKPAEMAHPDRLDHDEFERRHEDTIDTEKMADVIAGTPVGVATEVLRYVVPCQAETARQRMAGLLRKQDEKSERQSERPRTLSRKERRRLVCERKRLARKGKRKPGENSARRAPLANGGNGTGGHGADGKQDAAKER